MVFVSLWDINIQPNVSDNRASGHKELAGQTALLSCWSGMMLAHVGDQMLEYTSCFLFTATSHIRLSRHILLYHVFQLGISRHFSISAYWGFHWDIILRSILLCFNMFTTNVFLVMKRGEIQKMQLFYFKRLVRATAYAAL